MRRGCTRHRARSLRQDRPARGAAGRLWRLAGRPRPRTLSRRPAPTGSRPRGKRLELYRGAANATPCHRVLELVRLRRRAGGSAPRGVETYDPARGRAAGHRGRSSTRLFTGVMLVFEPGPGLREGRQAAVRRARALETRLRGGASGAARALPVFAGLALDRFRACCVAGLPEDLRRPGPGRGRGQLAAARQAGCIWARNRPGRGRRLH